MNRSDSSTTIRRFNECGQIVLAFSSSNTRQQAPSVFQRQWFQWDLLKEPEKRFAAIGHCFEQLLTGGDHGRERFFLQKCSQFMLTGFTQAFEEQMSGFPPESPAAAFRTELQDALKARPRFLSAID